MRLNARWHLRLRPAPTTPMLLCTWSFLCASDLIYSNGQGPHPIHRPAATVISRFTPFSLSGPGIASSAATATTSTTIR
jgi:hypothetical protein